MRVLVRVKNQLNNFYACSIENFYRIKGKLHEKVLEIGHSE